MKKTIVDITSTLNKISVYQFILTLLIALVSYFVLHDKNILSAFLISGGASFFFTQLLKLNLYNKTFALFGFPIRLIIIGIPCAILVHKLHSNLIALFIGFVICIAIHVIFFWSYARKIEQG